MHCPLCGFEYDETQLACQASCPMAELQGCAIVCCPNCGYQTVNEEKSGAAKWLKKWLKPSPPKVKSDDDDA